MLITEEESKKEAITFLDNYAFNYAVKFLIDEAKEETSLYMHTTYQFSNDSDPFDVELYLEDYDDDYGGSLAKINIREEYLDHFKDDPKHYKEKMPNIIKSLRDFADEIEQIYLNTE